MAVLASSIVTRVREQLIDTGTPPRWSDAELLRFLSDGQKTIVALAPAASAVIASHQLAAGTRQSIPVDGYMLLTIFRNMGTNGSTPGRVCRIVSRELLDAVDPDWHVATASAVVKNYIFDPATSDVFYVYPPNTGTGYVEMSYSVSPTELTSLSDELIVDELYSPALADYVMFRAHQKDSDFSAGQSLAQTYLALFNSFMQQHGAATLGENPNLQLTPPDMSVSGAAK